MGVLSRREENLCTLQKSMAGRCGILSLGDGNHLSGV